MKILWITNILFPDICKDLGIIEPVIGGWMYSLAKLLIQDSSLKLAVASVYSGKKLKSKEINGITYFLIPSQGKNTKYCTKMEEFWQEVKEKYSPDIIHIHGSEFAHGLAYIRACSSKNVIISIQGLVSIYQRYYYTGITNSKIIRHITFRDIVLRDNIFQQRLKMKKRGALEQEYIKSVDHVIGRTSWDKTHSLAINPIVKYHFCNETLRSEFYLHKWSFENCENFSIFISQAVYPIKGLHQVLKALPAILKKYPNTKLYVGGDDFVSVHSLKDRIRRNGYAKYLLKLMNNLNIRDKVVFTGLLNEKEMCSRYLKSHVFVCPSSIENSPNSLGEAQLLGVPCIASYVGGVPDMIENGRTGLLYRFEEIEMLSKAVCDIFNDSDLAQSLSLNGQMAAFKRHSTLENKKTMISIYNAVIK
jgi:Glycosyltransferase